MSHAWLVGAHAIGALLLGVALVAIWLAAERVRRAQDVGALRRAARTCATIEKRMIAPGVLLLLASGTWLTAQYYGWAFTRIPWLAGMVALFVFQSVWANTVTRLHALRLRRLLEAAPANGPVTPELERTRTDPLAAFGHYLEIPLFALIVALGVLRPASWTLFVLGSAVAVQVAAAAALYASRPAPAVPRLSSLSRASVEAEGGS